MSIAAWGGAFKGIDSHETPRRLSHDSHGLACRGLGGAREILGSRHLAYNAYDDKHVLAGHLALGKIARMQAAKTYSITVA